MWCKERGLSQSALAMRIGQRNAGLSGVAPPRYRTRPFRHRVIRGRHTVHGLDFAQSSVLTSQDSVVRFGRGYRDAYLGADLVRPNVLHRRRGQTGHPSGRA